jgi:hypothetical protein
VSAKKDRNKNTRKAALEIERLSWETFRFIGDGRQWQHLAQIRRAYLVKAANAADPDGTRVEIAVPTFTKAAGKGRTAYRMLDDLKEMGALLPVLYLDARGTPREQLSRFQGTRVRWLRWKHLETAQQLLDLGKPFLGHPRLTEEQQRELQIAQMSTDDQQKLAEKDCHLGREGMPSSPEIDGEGMPASKEGMPSSREGVPSSCEGMPPRVAHDRPCLTEDTHTENPPTIPAGGMDGDAPKSSSQNRGQEESGSQNRTPMTLWTAIVLKHRECRGFLLNQVKKPWQLVPSFELSRVGLPELEKFVAAYDYSREEILAAFQEWYHTYAKSMGTETPIQHPLTLFAKDAHALLIERRKDAAEDTEDEPVPA